MSDVRAYEISVQGFPPMLYSARSPGKARARAWQDYSGCYDCSFLEFMRRSKLRCAPWADAQHRRVLVLGKPATIIIHPHRRDLFIYDGTDVVLSAHPSDIQALSVAA